MQRLDLNLASNPFRNNTLLWVGYGTATVLLVLFTVWNVNTFVDYRARLLDLRDTVGTFRTQRLELETRGKRALDGIRRFDIEALEIKTDKANEVIEWKAFSWTRLFNVLERVLPYQVRMNSVRPIFNPSGASQDAEEVQAGAMPVSIEGTARSFDDLAELQRAFHDDAQIGRVEPERLDKTDAGEFVFQLRFLYVPTEEDLGQGGVADEGAEPIEGAEEPVEGVAAEGPVQEDGEPGTDGVEPTAEGEGTLSDPQPADPMAAPIEVTDPGPPGQGAAEGDGSGAPASKAKRRITARPRSAPARGRQPASRKKTKEDDR
jgi:hypothetical protein